MVGPNPRDVAVSIERDLLPWCMDLDEEGDDAASAGGVGSEDEAVCGGAATSELPQDSQELELSQD